MIEVTRDPHRQLSKSCKGCQEPATCWLVVGDANQRTVIAFCDDCAEQAVTLLTGAQCKCVEAHEPGCPVPEGACVTDCKRCEERGSLSCVECGR